MKFFSQMLFGLLVAMISLILPPTSVVSVRKVGVFRMKFRDVAFKYRMGAGFPGDVNRMHPASIEPCLNDATTPILLYGVPVTTTAAGNSVRPLGVDDAAAPTWLGVSVRPFPRQAASAGAYGAVGLGAAIPPAGEAIDVLRKGYIMVQLPTDAAPVVKGGPVYYRKTASAGTHTLGGFEGAADGANTAVFPSNITFNGPQDANGVVEVCIA